MRKMGPLSLLFLFVLRLTAVHPAQISAASERQLTIGGVDLPISCNFDDNNWCGWTHDEDYDWSLGTGPSSDYATGPSGDHTTGFGYYGYIEAFSSATGFQFNLSPFTLESPELSGGSSGVLVEFYYHMYGSGVGILEFDTFDGHTWTTAWSLTGNQGDSWYLASFDVVTQVTRVRFRGSTGSGSNGNMAVDDIVIASGEDPTAAPSQSPFPSVSPVPSSDPTLAPTSSPTFVYFQAVDSFVGLRTAAQQERAVINVTTSLVVMPDEIVVSGVVTIFSVCGTLLRSSSSNRHFSLLSGSRLKLDGLTLKNGYSWNDPGGSVTADGAHLEVLNSIFKDNGHGALYETTAYGGTISLSSSSTASFQNCLFQNSETTGDYGLNAYGGAVAIRSSSSAHFENCTFDSTASITTITTGLLQTTSGGGAVYVAEDSTCIFVRCLFSNDRSVSGDGVGASGGVLYADNSVVEFYSSTFVNNQADTQAGALRLAEGSSGRLVDCVFRGNQAPDAGVGVIDTSSSLSVDTSVFVSNRALIGNGGVFVGKVTVSASTFVHNTAYGSGGVLAGAGDFINSNVSSNTAIEGDGGVAFLTSSSTFEACALADGAAFEGKGALFYSTAATSIKTSSIQGFSSPNSAYILHHDPNDEAVLLALDRVVFEDNDFLAVHSTGRVALRNCDLSDEDVDSSRDLFVTCSSADAGEFCAKEYCADTPLGGMRCYCYPRGVAIDPYEGSCLSPPEITVSERKLIILAHKPEPAIGKFWALNQGDLDLVYTTEQSGQTMRTWNVTPSMGNLTAGQAIETIRFTLDTTRLEARAGPYHDRFSLLSNSADEANRNLTIVTELIVSADPVARLSYVTLDSPNKAIAGGSLSFYLTLVDETQVVILDAFDVAFSAVLTHPASTTSVACSVLYDANSERHEGDCKLPDLVCGEGMHTADCELSPPVGAFDLEVNDTQGMAVGATRYSFTVDGCPASYYKINGKCLACPNQVSCEAGSLITDWQLHQGQWRSHVESSDVRECRFGVESCPGNTTNDHDAYCSPQYVGPLCSECADGYFMSWVGDGTCKRCATGQSHVPTIGLIAGLLVCAAMPLGCALNKCRKWCLGKLDASAMFEKVEKMLDLAKTKFFMLFLAAQVRYGGNLRASACDHMINE